MSSGPVLKIEPEEQYFSYTADSKGGSSGASVISIASGKIYGVHTHGWCDEEGGWNSATLILKNEKLKTAIKNLLRLGKGQSLRISITIILSRGNKPTV